jgi:hypothetical protein
VYLFDLNLARGFGLSYYLLKEDGVGGFTQKYYGIRYSGELEDIGPKGISLNAFILGNTGIFKKGGSFPANTAADFENSGFAGKVEVKIPVGPVKIGLLGLYASGDKDFKDSAKTSSNSFITPMSLIGHHGYWGYTGKLCIQGPTDTGIDDPIRIDGGSYGNQTLGLGLTSLQVNVDIPVIPDKFSFYGAAGIFRLNDAAPGKEKNVGTDIYLQGKYMFGERLSLEFGVDFASLGKGHFDAYGSKDPKSKSVTVIFSRLQLEY